MQGYAWPGNVRELENLIERAVIVSTSDRLIIDLPERRSERTLFPQAETKAVGQAGANSGSESRLDLRAEPPFERRTEPNFGDLMAGNGEEHTVQALAPSNEQERIALECRMIEQALAASGGKVHGPGGAAERLCLKPTTAARQGERSEGA